MASKPKLSPTTRLRKQGHRVDEKNGEVTLNRNPSDTLPLRTVSDVIDLEAKGFVTFVKPAPAKKTDGNQDA